MNPDIELLMRARAHAPQVLSSAFTTVVTRELNQGIDSGSPLPRDIDLAREILRMHSPMSEWLCRECGRPDSPFGGDDSWMCPRHRPRYQSTPAVTP